MLVAICLHYPLLSNELSALPALYIQNSSWCSLHKILYSDTMALRRCLDALMLLCTAVGLCHSCLRNAVVSWKPSVESKQELCKTINGTNWARAVTFEAGENTSCTGYKTIVSDSYIDGFCAQRKLFNLDLCDCWYSWTVDPVTCRTKPAYSVAELRDELFERYSNRLTEVTCQPLPTERWRTVLYSSVGSQRCNMSHGIRWQKNTGRMDTQIWKGHYCPTNQLFNFDLCDCWDERVTDSQTCRTKPGYDVSALRDLLADKYNNSELLELTQD